MKTLKIAALAVSLLLAPHAVPVQAGDNDPLFVNLLTREPHRTRMALSFSHNQLQRGHPVTVFFNDQGVVVLSKKNAKAFAEHQKLISDLMRKGAQVLACPMCMKHYGVEHADLLDGVKVGNPELTGAALFKDNTKTLTW